MKLDRRLTKLVFVLVPAEELTNVGVVADGE